jgi:riboflavin biosynthesis pyrimidine reductase
VLTDRARLETAEAAALTAAGAIVKGVDPGPDGGLDLGGVFALLHREAIDGVMVEGGGQLLSSMASADFIDQWEIWVAPRATGNGGGILAAELDPPLRAAAMRVWEYGEDLLVRALPEAELPPGLCDEGM